MIQNEIAQSQYRRANFLLLESKKQISRKKLEKFNVNKFLMAKGTPSLFSLYENAYVPFTVANNDDFYRQRVFSLADVQKLQAEIDKAQFSFSFDCDLQQAVKIAFNSKQLKPLQAAANAKAKASEIIEKIIKTEVNNSGGTAVKRVPSDHFTTTAHGYNVHSLFYIDSLAALERRASARSKQPGKVSGKTATQDEYKTPDFPTVYAYGFSNERETKVNNVKKNIERLLKDQPWLKEDKLPLLL